MGQAAGDDFTDACAVSESIAKHTRSLPSFDLSSILFVCVVLFSSRRPASPRPSRLPQPRIENTIARLNPIKGRIGLLRMRTRGPASLCTRQGEWGFLLGPTGATSGPAGPASPLAVSALVVQTDFCFLPRPLVSCQHFPAFLPPPSRSCVWHRCRQDWLQRG